MCKPHKHLICRTDFLNSKIKEEKVPFGYKAGLCHSPSAAVLSKGQFHFGSPCRKGIAYLDFKISFRKNNAKPWTLFIKKSLKVTFKNASNSKIAPSTLKPNKYSL